MSELKYPLLGVVAIVVLFFLLLLAIPVIDYYGQLWANYWRFA